jgi:membrane protease YdiL (CAAX protease family)
MPDRNVGRIERSPASQAGLLAFFALTYVLGWACFFGSGLHVPPDSPLRTPLLMLGTFAPGIAGILLVAVREGRAGLSDLGARLVRTDVGWRWYVFALSWLMAIKLAAAILHRVILGEWPEVADGAPLLLAGSVLVSVLVGTPLQAGEEIGWRGYALPRMAERIGHAWASLLLGVVWGVWHLPLFLVAGVSSNFGQSFPVMLLGTTALSVALAWLSVNTRGSLLLAMLMHSAVNHTGAIVPTRWDTPGNPWAVNTSPIVTIASALMLASTVWLVIRLRRSDRQISEPIRSNI